MVPPLRRAADRGPGQDIGKWRPPVARGLVLEARVEDLRDMYGYLDATFHALQAVVPVIRRQPGGQIVVFTSDPGARRRRRSAGSVP